MVKFEALTPISEGTPLMATCTLAENPFSGVTEPRTAAIPRDSKPGSGKKPPAGNPVEAEGVRKRRSNCPLHSWQEEAIPARLARRSRL